jgi:cardiolipin synthase
MIHVLTESRPWLLAIADIGLAVAATVHAVLWKRDSRAVIGWVGLAWLAPIVGPLLYFCFGVNRICRRGVTLKVRESWHGHRQPDLKPEEVERRDSFSRKHQNVVGLATLGKTLSGMPVLPGNKVEPLVTIIRRYNRFVDQRRLAKAAVLRLERTGRER